MCREWEAECLWGYYGWQCANVRHLRLGFYTGDIFTKEPTMDQDVPPIVAELKRIDPDVITVAFDPEASGPDTHYKVMQAFAEALRIHLDKTGFMRHKIIVPEFVLHELQIVSDSQVPLTRAKGRRGLETLKRLQDLRLLLRAVILEIERQLDLTAGCGLFSEPSGHAGAH